jgi:hypothetical protein
MQRPTALTYQAAFQIKNDPYAFAFIEDPFAFPFAFAFMLLHRRGVKHSLQEK